MTKSKIKIRKSAAFLDVNIFAKEEFTSGLLITIREIFRRLQDLNISANVLSVAHAPNSKNWKHGAKHGKSARTIQGIPIKEFLITDSYRQNPAAYINSIRELLKESKPTVLFLNTTAIFLEELHMLTLEEAISSGAKVSIILVDALFPTYKTHNKSDVDKYYQLIRKTQVISTSRTLINLFYKETGILAEYFPNLFTVRDIISKQNSRRYITLINHHPIKGREVFNAIAKKMPDKEFLAVENWPDVPSYVSRPNNIILSKFMKDVKGIYGKTRILLIPSLCDEGPARIIMEGLLNEIPVMAHKIGSIPEIGHGKIFLINPPPINGSILINKIIYPQVNPIDIDMVSNKFVETIMEVDNNSLHFKKHIREAKNYALQYCEGAESLFLTFVKDWFY